MLTIHCAQHRENLVAKIIGSRDPIAILQTVISSVHKIRIRALQDRLFQEACRDENFHRLVYSTDVSLHSISNCLSRVVLLLDKVFEFLQTMDIILMNSLIDNKMLILYMGEIYRKLNELNLSLQNRDMNIFLVNQIIKAFMNKLVIWKMKAMTHNICYFPSFDGNEIDYELQIVNGNHLSFLHNNFQIRFGHATFVNFLQTMTIEHVMDQNECVQIKLCEANVDERLIQAIDKNLVKAWLQSPIKYRILYKKVEPFIINLPIYRRKIFRFCSIHLHCCE